MFFVMTDVWLHPLIGDALAGCSRLLERRLCVFLLVSAYDDPDLRTRSFVAWPGTHCAHHEPSSEVIIVSFQFHFSQLILIFERNPF